MCLFVHMTSYVIVLFRYYLVMNIVNFSTLDYNKLTITFSYSIHKLYALWSSSSPLLQSIKTWIDSMILRIISTLNVASRQSLWLTTVSLSATTISSSIHDINRMTITKAKEKRQLSLPSSLLGCTSMRYSTLNKNTVSCV